MYMYMYYICSLLIGIGNAFHNLKYRLEHTVLYMLNSAYYIGWQKLFIVGRIDPPLKYNYLAPIYKFGPFFIFIVHCY